MISCSILRLIVVIDVIVFEYYYKENKKLVENFVQNVYNYLGGDDLNKYIDLDVENYNLLMV